MSYYFMQCVAWKVDLRELQPGRMVPELSAGAFRRGKRIAMNLPEPLHWNVIPAKGEMPAYFSSPALVVRRDFAEALKQCGVDNIDYYAIVLHDPETKETWDEYVIANVIGDVDAIDMAKSEIDPDSPPTTAVLFDNIVIDESKCRDFRMFRPRHKHSALLVSKEVKDSIEARGFRHVAFVEPQEYA